MIVYDKNKRELVIPNGLGNLNGLAESYLEAAREDGREEIRAYMTELTVTENGRYTNKNGWDVVLVNVDSEGDGSYDEGYDDGYDEGYDDGYYKASIPFGYVNEGSETSSYFISAIEVELSERFENNNGSIEGIFSKDIYTTAKQLNDSELVLPMSIYTVLDLATINRDFGRLTPEGEEFEWSEFYYMGGFYCEYVQTISTDAFDGLNFILGEMRDLGKSFITEQTFITPNLTKLSDLRALYELVDSLYDFSTENAYGVSSSNIEFRGFEFFSTEEKERLTEYAGEKGWIVL